eukprot:3530787-Prymnesium_polylepis.2
MVPDYYCDFKGQTRQSNVRLPNRSSCDFPAQNIEKMAYEELELDEPDAWTLLQNMVLTFAA